ncbi:MAG: KOW domain-containing RNA-binding protein [Tissierellia bacterium]|nr:KOW domain-containing RNA-binding protein [Tissierellia bacterium]
MDRTTGIVPGQVVKSKAGRDKDRFFMVLEIKDESYLTLVDGDLRKLSKPKLKKIKHIMVTNTVIPIDTTSIHWNDSYIRKHLEPFREK